MEFFIYGVKLHGIELIRTDNEFFAVQHMYDMVYKEGCSQAWVISSDKIIDYFDYTIWQRDIKNDVAPISIFPY